jgi:prepilin-type N-terminal cleavage/methylation domain-containing protein
MNNLPLGNRSAKPNHRRWRRVRTRSPIVHPGARGFTLIEILLALAVTAMVALVVATLLFSVANGTASRDAVQGNNSLIDVTCSRINTAVRPAGRVLAQADGMLVFWTSNSDGNNKPNLSEIRRLELDATTGNLVLYAAPQTINPWDDTSYDLAQDFASITAALRGTTNFPGTTLMSSVQQWTPTPVGAISVSKLLTYRVTINGPTGALSVRATVAMRGQISGTTLP